MIVIRFEQKLDWKQTQKNGTKKHCEKQHNLDVIISNYEKVALIMLILCTHQLNSMVFNLEAAI